MRERERDVVAAGLPEARRAEFKIAAGLPEARRAEFKITAGLSEARRAEFKITAGLSEARRAEFKVTARSTCAVVGFPPSLHLSTGVLGSRSNILSG